MDRASWCYICGMISAQWDRLLDEHAFRELIKTDPEKERYQRLRSSLLFGETDLGDRPIGQIERAFADTVSRTAEMSPDNRIADLFLQELDWHDFRQFAKSVMLKKTVAGQSEPAESDERFTLCWNGRPEDERDMAFAEAARHIAAELPAEGDRAGWIDAAVDAHEAAALLRSAACLDSEQVANWVRTWVNLRAGLSLIRARRIGWEVSDILLHWQSVGFDEPALADLASGRETEWPGALRNLGLSDTEAALAKTETTLQLARLIDNCITTLASESKGIPFGPERVFAFLWALRLEAINLRLAISATAFGARLEGLAEELRITHV